MDEKNIKFEPKGSEIKFGLRLVAVTTVIIVVLFGLYWGGRQLFVSEEIAVDNQRELPISELGCDKIYTDLKEALVDSSKNKVAVCGLDISGDKNLRLTVGLSMMDSLIVIDASDNIIKEVPEWIDQLPQLRVLNLSGNKISSIPLSLTKAKRLEVLDLTGNPLPPGDVQNLRGLLPDTKVKF